MEFRMTVVFATLTLIGAAAAQKEQLSEERWPNYYAGGVDIQWIEDSVLFHNILPNSAFQEPRDYDHHWII